MGLEAVELIMAYEEAFGVEITDTDAVTMRTPHDVIEFIASRLPIAREGSCLEQSAFYMVRSALKEIAGRSRSTIRPGTPLSHVFVLMEPRLFERELRTRLGVEWLRLPTEPFTTVGELSRKLACEAPLVVKRGRPWTRDQIARVVKDRTLEILGDVEYAEGQRFIDLGVG